MTTTFQDEMDQRETELKKHLATSKKAPGLKDKVLHFPVADGTCYYRVAEVADDKVLLEWIPFWDDYQEPFVGDGGWFLRPRVEALVKQAEEWDAKMERMVANAR